MLASSATGEPGGDLYHLPGCHEPFSAMSHLGGALVFLVLGIVLLWRGRGSLARLTFLGTYVVSGVALLSLSGVYHMMARGGTPHVVLQRLDHGAIFLLIAGTFTPPHGLLFRGWMRWAPLLVVWAAAIAGLTLKTIFFDDLSHGLSMCFYLALGWFGGISAILLALRYGSAVIKLPLLGGLAYSIGALADLFQWPTLIPGVIHPHEVFHIAVLAGVSLHWLFIWDVASGKFRPFSRAVALPAPAPEPALAADAAASG